MVYKYVLLSVVLLENFEEKKSEKPGKRAFQNEQIARTSHI